MNVHRINPNRSLLGATISPYANRMAFNRWFFYRRFQSVLEAAGPIPEGRVLELGCWEGFFLPSLLRHYREVWAVDNDSNSLVSRLLPHWSILQVARGLCVSESDRVENLRLLQADGGLLPFRGRSFDAVFVLDTLPYVIEESRLAFVTEVGRVLKPDGVAVFTLPIEIGPVILIREMLRWISGAWRDGYRAGELVRGVLRRPVARHPDRGAYNLRGYDYRHDLRLIQRILEIERITYLPYRLLRPLSPTILVLCHRKR